LLIQRQAMIDLGFVWICQSEMLRVTRPGLRSVVTSSTKQLELWSKAALSSSSSPNDRKSSHTSTSSTHRTTSLCVADPGIMNRRKR